MKKLGYLLSILFHAAWLLVIVLSEFRVVILPEPPRVIQVVVGEPPPPFWSAAELPAGLDQGAATMAGPGARASTASAGPGTGGAAAASGLSAARRFSLSSSPTGDFRLKPVGRSSEPWQVAIGPPAPGSRLRNASPLGAPLDRGLFSGRGPGSSPSRVVRVPFDVKDKEAAAWTEAVLTRVERNWVVPPSARLAAAGRVKVTLVVEKSGRLRSLAVADPPPPEPLSRAALLAVQASLPLPPLPEHIAGDAFAFTFVFTYNG